MEDDPLEPTNPEQGNQFSLETLNSLNELLQCKTEEEARDFGSRIWARLQEIKEQRVVPSANVIDTSTPAEPPEAPDLQAAPKLHLSMSEFAEMLKRGEIRLDSVGIRDRTDR